MLSAGGPEQDWESEWVDVNEEEVEGRIAQLEALQAQLQAEEEGSISRSASAAVGMLQALEPLAPGFSEDLLSRSLADLASLSSQNAALAAGLRQGDLDALAALLGASSPESVDSVVAASQSRAQDMVRGLGNAVELQQEVHLAEQRAAMKHKGVDITILIDGSGSMRPYIEQVKKRAQEIMVVAPLHFPEAITRLAVVVYRDFYNGDQRIEAHDFVGKESISELVSFVSSIQPISNDDACEDVAGGLQALLGLSWESSTRLVVHLGDMPPHGSKYHVHSCTARYLDVNDYDKHPSGDPNGLDPKVLVQQLCRNHIDYHFAEITEHTAKMVEEFQEVYKSHPTATFTKHSMSDPAEHFMPLMVKSIVSSMRSSGFFSSPGSSSVASSALPSFLKVRLGTCKG